MSLGGIAIAIGVLVDAGIVITENVFRHYETDEGRKPVIGSSGMPPNRSAARFFFPWSHLLAFLPVSRSRGRREALPPLPSPKLRHGGATVLAVTLVPVLASFSSEGKSGGRTKPVMRSPGGSTNLAAWALDHKRMTIGVAGALFVVSVVWSPGPNSAGAREGSLSLPGFGPADGGRRTGRAE